MSEAQTLRGFMRAALAALDAGAPPNVENARQLLREGLATPRDVPAEAREVTGLDYRGG